MGVERVMISGSLGDEMVSTQAQNARSLGLNSAGDAIFLIFIILRTYLCISRYPCGFELWLSQTKDFLIYSCHFLSGSSAFSG